MMDGASLASSARELMARARAEAGIDIVDTEMAEPLERFVASLNTEARLDKGSAAAMTDRILRILANRLRMERDFRAHPEIAAQEIRRPVFLTGTGRTGSTKLHKLLAATGDFKFLTFWQAHTLALRTGDRREDPGPRIRESAAYIAWVDSRAPQLRLIHAYDIFEPEEESLIFEFCRFQPPIVIFVDVPSYIEWHGAQDFRVEMRFLKRALQYLQWQFHDGDARPWVMKCPIYPGFELLIREVFPDAAMVATHRDPVKAFASMASLWEHYRSLYTDHQDRAALGPLMLEGQAMVMRRHLAVRDADAGLDILDVAYRELTRDSAGVIETIYAQAGTKVTGAIRDAVTRWECENSQHKHGVHDYRLEDYGLSRTLIEQHCAPYIERYRSFL